jgi:8-oxo-dGTP diphosphatase
MTSQPRPARTAPVGPLHRLALRTYRALPRPVRVLATRTIAPGHTVGALCFLERDGRVLMLEQHHRSGWTLPGGLLNRGENAAQAVVREVREETGLDVEVGLPFATLVAPRSRRVDILFHVRVDRPVQVAAHGEAIRAGWLTPDEAGTVDEPTATSFAAWQRWRAGHDAAHVGRLLPPDARR